MGHHSLPPSYDAWRLAGPEEFAPRRRVNEAEFSRVMELHQLQSIDAECEFSVTSGDCVKLECVVIEGRRFSPEFIREWLGTAQNDALEAEGQSYWLDEGWREAEAEYADGLADYEYERRRDDH